jgi:hypothetical protein
MSIGRPKAAMCQNLPSIASLAIYRDTVTELLTLQP